MSYTVFALKWRPKNFDEIIGQGHIVTTLKNAVEKNRLANAYLFAGPRGVGKTSTARILAKSLNCKNGPTVVPCEKCPSCLEVAASRSFDVIEIDGASNRGIDEIRQLRENVKFSPSTGRYKIYIIDEVHMLTTEAFNALLKTLEEPPAFVKFIFATTQAHKMPPTILSRCQRFDFRRIPVTEIIRQLEHIIAQEKIKIDRDVLFTIARASDGALRDAESLLDQLASFSEDKISLKDVISILGIIEQEALFEITDKIIQKDAKAALELFSRLIDEGKDANLLLTNLIEHFRNLMIAKVAQADSKLVDLPQEICEKLLRQSQHFTLEEILADFNAIVNAHEMFKRMESLRIPLEVILIKLAHDKKGPGQSQAVSFIPKAEKEAAQIKKSDDCKNTVGGGPAERKTDTETDTKNSVTLENVKTVWGNVIETLSGVKMSVSTYLNEGEAVKLEGNVLTVSFPKNYSLHKESLESKENKAIIEKTLGNLLHASLRVNFVLSKETAVKEDNLASPFVKSALEAFKARVVREG